LPNVSSSFNVKFSATRFPPGIVPNGVLSFDASDLARALFVTGRAPGDRQAHGFTSVWEWIHRTTLMPAYVRRDRAGRLLKSALAESLDRSEKIGVSYALGQALTEIFCEQHLGVRYLMHVDRYAARWNVRFGSGRSRPDLFGITPGGAWVVAEAKGRSNAMEPGLANKLRSQKAMIQTINGQPPHLSLGCVASFPPVRAGQQGSLRVDAVDPDPGEDAISIDIDLSRFFRAYYEPFATVMTMGRPSDLSNDEVQVVDLPGLRLSVGLRRELLVNPELAKDLLDAPQFGGLAPDSVSLSDGTPVRSDGTFVRASWAEYFDQQDVSLG
jgi:hypothetical protein